MLTKDKTTKSRISCFAVIDCLSIVPLNNLELLRLILKEFNKLEVPYNLIMHQHYWTFLLDILSSLNIYGGDEIWFYAIEQLKYYEDPQLRKQYVKPIIEQLEYIRKMLDSAIEIMNKINLFDLRVSDTELFIAFVDYNISILNKENYYGEENGVPKVFENDRENKKDLLCKELIDKQYESEEALLEELSDYISNEQLDIYDAVDIKRYHDK